MTSSAELRLGRYNFRAAIIGRDLSWWSRAGPKIRASVSPKAKSQTNIRTSVIRQTAAMDGSTASAAASPPGFIRSRIANACDGCKARKVKCDGKHPCSYCVRRQRPHACHYTPQRRARQRRSTAGNNGLAQTASPVGGRSTRDQSLEDQTNGADASGVGENGAAQRHSMLESNEDDTEVPREARLLYDAQGKLIFIGDCAPLSFFQSVRQLVTSRVKHNAFAPETSRYTVLENASPGQPTHRASSGFPEVRTRDVAAAVGSYITATTGLVDLFDESRLADDILLWANHDQKPHNLTSTINYLVLAIGRQKVDEASSQAYYEYAKEQAFRSLSGNLSVGTVQAFTLITVYMLWSCQINSAFLVFGIAVRAAYSIGIHRTEVNARFGPEIHRQRDRLWKSLRVVDLFLSTSMGRPAATSDVDCTVPYRSTDDAGNETFDLLNASVQILIIIESIVLEIYSRKKISLQLTEGISHKLREWSSRWLHRLKDVINQPLERTQSQISGACQVLSSYYYGVMLVSRPFLMYEICRRLADGPTAAVMSRETTLNSGKSRLADACIDAASLMVDPILDLVDQGVMDGRMPLLV